MHLKTINAAIADKGYTAELVKGKRYFYFSGPAVEGIPNTSVYVNKLSQLTTEQWVLDLEHKLQEHSGKIARFKAEETRRINKDHKNIILVWDTTYNDDVEENILHIIEFNDGSMFNHNKLNTYGMETSIMKLSNFPSNLCDDKGDIDPIEIFTNSIKDMFLRHNEGKVWFYELTPKDINL